MRVRVRVRAAIAGVALALLASCAGGVDRQRLDDIRRERGGGLSQQEVLASVELARRDLAVEELQLRSVSVAPGRVALEVRARDGVAAYAFGDGTQRGPTPVAGSQDGAALFTIDQAGVERFDRMVDEALAEADYEEGYAVGAEIRRPAPDAEPQVEVWVAERQREASVVFAADGTVVEVRT